MTRWRHAPWALAVVGLAGLACHADLDKSVSLLDTTRVVAVLFEPPETVPGVSVRVTPVLAGPSGLVADARTSAAFCASPALLGENGAAPSSCAKDDAVYPPVEVEGSTSLVVPVGACFTFGPEITTADLRPRDPDATGGYFQPLRLRVPAGETAYGLLRVTCSPANLPADLARRLRGEYRSNQNPTGLSLGVLVGGSVVPLGVLPREARVRLRASWAPESAETYVALDTSRTNLVPRREALRVSWYVTAGALDLDRTGRSETELEPYAENEFGVPSTPGLVHVIAVLRDDRGGATVAATAVQVE